MSLWKVRDLSGCKVEVSARCCGQKVVPQRDPVTRTQVDDQVVHTRARAARQRQASRRDARTELQHIALAGRARGAHVQNHILAVAPVEVVLICAFCAHQRVIAGPPVKQVVGLVALQGVVACGARKNRQVSTKGKQGKVQAITAGLPRSPQRLHDLSPPSPCSLRLRAKRCTCAMVSALPALVSLA